MKPTKRTSTRTKKPSATALAIAEELAQTSESETETPPASPLATPPQEGWPEPEPPKYPPQPTLDPSDPLAKQVETLLNEKPTPEKVEPLPLPAAPPQPPPPPMTVAAAAAQPLEPDPTTRCFKKVNVALPFFFNGKPVRFEALGGNVGIITLNAPADDELIAALDQAADARRGGVVPITAQERDELKKNPPLTRSKRDSQPAIRVWNDKPRALNRGLDESAVPKIALPRPASTLPSGSGSETTSGVGGSFRGSAAPVAKGDAASPGKPAAFAPALQRKSEGKNPLPLLRPPATGTFRSDVKVV